MKKLVFTALAVVAFSGAAMAKTAEVKEEVLVGKESEVVILAVQGPGDSEATATPCQDAAINIYEYVMNTYNNGCDNLDLLHNLLAQCK
jgi:hypothetical protein